MTEDMRKDVNEMIRQAKMDDAKAKAAENVVEDTIQHMNPQRQYNENKGQNKR